MTLLKKMEDHISAIQNKIAALEITGTALPPDEVRRDIAIGMELHQKYIDLLDEALEEIDENAQYGDGESHFLKFGKFFDVWFSRLTPKQVEQFTRRGVIA